MEKNPVEQSPKLDYLAPNFSEIYPYLSQWGIVDDKGRYLPWCKLKWRVPSKEAKNIWWAIKFRREQVKKISAYLINMAMNIFLPIKIGRSTHYIAPADIRDRL